MIDEKEKTALGTSVGADAGQSIQSQTILSVWSLNSNTTPQTLVK